MWVVVREGSPQGSEKSLVQRLCETRDLNTGGGGEQGTLAPGGTFWGDDILMSTFQKLKNCNSFES